MPEALRQSDAVKRSRAEHPHETLNSTGRERSKKRRLSRESGLASQTAPVSREDSSANRAVSTAVETTQSGELDKASRNSQLPWSLLQVVGGRYSELDPIFSVDEKFIFLALEKAIHIFSTSTSRLFRTLQLEASAKIVGYQLSPTSDEHLYVFTSSGSVRKWDWTSGRQISSWETSCKTFSASICSIDVDEAVLDALYSLRQRKDGRRELSITILKDGNADAEHAGFVALETSRSVKHITLSNQGRVVVISDGQHIFVGDGKAGASVSPESLHYTWRELSLPVTATCFDVRESLPAEGSKSAGSRAKPAAPAVDLVLGESSGSILIYHDVVNSLSRRENSQETEGRSLVFRKLHWHRGAVMAVRWSRDGNYLISGGSESVMVLWQLDTGRKQFLPHLSAPICNIIISPTGNSYAVKLADNTAIILSATELQTSSAIIGLQLPPSRTAQTTAPTRSGVSSSRILDAIPAVLHPRNSDHLLVAVPASQTAGDGKDKTANLCFLQTVDIRSGSHLSRQALARTNTTVLNTGPEGTKILPPDVKFLDITQDGQWLATVDDWLPYPQDATAFDPGCDGDGPSAGYSRETFLKFWMWNDSTKLWELVTRINEPHSRLQGGAMSVIGLASRPGTHEFVTLGADGILRFWDAVPRHQSHIKPRTDAAQPQETWRCRRSVNLKSSTDGSLASQAASMSFSEDGSVLAVCLPSQSSSSAGFVHLVDADVCELRQTRQGLFSGNPCGVRFLGRHLIVASEQSLSVWDTVNDVSRAVELSGSGSNGSTTRGSPILLSANRKTNSFAIITCRFGTASSSQSNKRRHKTKFHVEIYNPQSSRPVFQSALRCHPLALLPDPVTGDFIVLDTSAYVQRIGCSSTGPEPAVSSNELSPYMKTELDGLFGWHAPKNVPALESLPNESARAGPSDLGSIFGSAPPYLLSPVSVLFRDVVGAIVGK
ncbi:NET1-associated nuclear protein 1 [Paecilomyces lecythidis]